MVRRSSLVVLILLSTSASAQAVYRWVDSEGITHYTDSPGSIPKGVTVFATDGEPISELGHVAPVPAKPAQPVPPAQPPVAEPSVPTGAEQYWRAQFRAAKEKIHTIEDEITADRRRVEEVGGLPVGTRYSCYPGSTTYIGGVAQPLVGPFPGGGYLRGGNCISTINPEYDRARERLERNRKTLERAKEELSDLERRASFEAVPNEWRR
jgi:hypothetical protein